MKREINDYTMFLIPDGLRDVTAIFKYVSQLPVRLAY